MLDPAELAALRQDYSQRGLRRGELDPDPVVQFNAWLAEAQVRQIIEPNAMTLATVDAGGQPWTRTVLLKIYDARGFTFFTNYEGAKARHLADNPHAALTFWWGALERQVNVTGVVEKTSREESDAYFHSRPASSQLGAWASPQSKVVAGARRSKRSSPQPWRNTERPKSRSRRTGAATASRHRPSNSGRAAAAASTTGSATPASPAGSGKSSASPRNGRAPAGDPAISESPYPTT